MAGFDGKTGKTYLPKHLLLWPPSYPELEERTHAEYQEHQAKHKSHVDICLAGWPEAESGMYDPRCCRFPKSCSI